MTTHDVPAQAEIEALVGHRFPGGDYRIAHWENVLLTGCTGADLLPQGLAHPSCLFHLPIAGSGTSIAEMFALGQAESDLSIMIESYDWEFHQPLREEIDYRVEGCISSAERIQEEDREYDRIQFRFDITLTTGEPVARSLVTWHYTRNTL
ncbi:MAG: hypothetical protein ABJL54_09780 [Halioglobus sp.]